MLSQSFIPNLSDMCCVSGIINNTEMWSFPVKGWWFRLCSYKFIWLFISDDSLTYVTYWDTRLPLKCHIQGSMTFKSVVERKCVKVYPIDLNWTTLICSNRNLTQKFIQKHTWKYVQTLSRNLTLYWLKFLEFDTYYKYKDVNLQ